MPPTITTWCYRYNMATQKQHGHTNTAVKRGVHAVYTKLAQNVHTVHVACTEYARRVHRACMTCLQSLHWAMSMHGVCHSLEDCGIGGGVGRVVLSTFYVRMSTKWEYDFGNFITFIGFWTVYRPFFGTVVTNTKYKPKNMSKTLCFQFSKHREDSSEGLISNQDIQGILKFRKTIIDSRGP